MCAVYLLVSGQKHCIEQHYVFKHVFSKYPVLCILYINWKICIVNVTFKLTRSCCLADLTYLFICRFTMLPLPLYRLSQFIQDEFAYQCNISGEQRKEMILYSRPRLVLIGHIMFYMQENGEIIFCHRLFAFEARSRNAGLGGQIQLLRINMAQMYRYMG